MEPRHLLHRHPPLDVSVRGPPELDRQRPGRRDLLTWIAALHEIRRLLVQPDEVHHRQIVLVRIGVGRVPEQAQQQPRNQRKLPDSRGRRRPRRPGYRKRDVHQRQHRQQVAFERRTAQNRDRERLRYRQGRRNAPRAATERCGAAPGQRHGDPADPMEVLEEDREAAPGQRDRDPHRVEREQQVVVGENGVAEHVASGAVQHQQPAAERYERQGEPQRLAPAPLRNQPHGEHQRGHQTGLFHQYQRGAGQRRAPKVAAQKQQQRQEGEQHGRHVELGHHGLRVEQRRGHQQGHGRERRRSAHAPAELDGQQERQPHRHRRGRQHRQACCRNREAEDPPHQRQVRHHPRRVYVGRGHVRHQVAMLEQIERGWNELADFVPVERQVQERQVDQHHHQREGPQKEEVAPQPPPCGRRFHRPPQPPTGQLRPAARAVPAGSRRRPIRTASRSAEGC